MPQQKARLEGLPHHLDGAAGLALRLRQIGETAREVAQEGRSAVKGLYSESAPAWFITSWVA
jgi:hypothetical protein